VWWSDIVDLLQEETNKLHIDGDVHSDEKVGMQHHMYNTLAELTALKETVTNISTDKTGLQQSLEKPAQEVAQTEARLEAMTAQKKEIESEIVGLWNLLTEAQSAHEKLKLDLRDVRHGSGQELWMLQDQLHPAQHAQSYPWTEIVQGASQWQTKPMRKKWKATHILWEEKLKLMPGMWRPGRERAVSAIDKALGKHQGQSRSVARPIWKKIQPMRCCS
jgi:chromosome segregation ATPase